MNYYDRIAEGYNELHGSEQRRKIGKIAEAISQGEGETVLDVGCGTGIAFEFFDDIIGIDPSEELVKQVPGDAIVGVAENLPFEEDSFDIVICVSSLHNTEDAIKSLEEMKRVCKNRLAITVFKKGDPKKVDALTDLIHEKFHVLKQLDDLHDHIFICK